MTGRESQTRLTQQIAFLTEVDKLKSINRSSFLISGNRFENSAEHSWHLALYALVLEPFSTQDINLHRVIVMLLLHDIVEIDVGDHPIDQPTDWQAVARAEQVAAQRIFGILPADQSREMLSLWLEFEADETPDARFAKDLDRCQPIFQTLFTRAEVPDHLEIVKENLRNGRAKSLRTRATELYNAAQARLGHQKSATAEDLTRCLNFLVQADDLKNVYRGTSLCDGSRKENSGEHSWHIALYALILAEHANRPIKVDRILKMLLIHDLVEIDAGDNPIHGDHDVAAMEAIEQAAADRLYGLLPKAQGEVLRRLWDEFETAESDDAIFAKSVDRVQPVVSNLETNGGSWIEYNVSRQQLEDRVGWKVEQGAPALWAHLQARIKRWLEAHSKP